MQNAGITELSELFRRVSVWILFAFLLTICARSNGGSLSFSTDFDGIGSGSSISVSSFSRYSSSTGPSTSSWQGSGNAGTDDGAYIRRIYEEQLEQARKRAREEELKRQIEEKKRLDDLDAIRALQQLRADLNDLQKDGPSTIERMRLTGQVFDMEKTFATERKDYQATMPSYRDRLAWSLDHIAVPPPSFWEGLIRSRKPRHYERIMIWGLWRTPEDAAKALREGLQDPFNGNKFNDIFAFGSAGPRDILRVSLDYLLGQFGRLSSDTTAHLAELKGATADEVVCHSNGCRVAEVLISTGMLKANRLRVLGGDDAWFDLADLKKLQEEKRLQEVSVYIIKGDKVPVHNSAWRIMEMVPQIGHPLQKFENMRADLTYQALGLTDRPQFDPTSPFQVHIMSYPAASTMDFVEKHLYENYARMIKGWRLTQCFNSDGTLNQRCMLY
jgi:hypothetical protein